MSVVRWQDRFSIGVAFIDADHQVLVSLINQLYEAREEGQAREVVGSVFNVLVEYMHGHFQREERLMEQFGYPDVAEHKAGHREMARRIGQFRADYDAGRYAAVDELLIFLKNWLVDHILGEDTRLGPWISEFDLGPDALDEIVRIPAVEGA